MIPKEVPVYAIRPSGIYCEGCPHYDPLDVLPEPCRGCLLGWARKVNGLEATK